MSISPSYLTPEQRQVVESPLDIRMFLHGPAGTGKTTAGVERLLHLRFNGIPGDQILLLVPQRTLATPYYEALRSPGIPAGGVVSILTVGGLARRMVDLFWPLVAAEAGFAQPDRPPTFLTLETAQYYMAQLVRPLLAEGYFEAITLDRNRLYSQILDNLSKAAVHGFPHTEIGERLRSAWVGDPAQAHIYQDAQDCANRFRQYCLANNLLDFSLQLEIFIQRLWTEPLCRNILLRQYHHLVFDNLEEATPVSADMLGEWLPHFESALLIFDQEAGYRRFLGADPDTAATLADYCEAQVAFEVGIVASEPVRAFGAALGRALKGEERGIELELALGEELELGESALVYPQPPVRFYPEMLDWVCEQIAVLIEGGTPPGEIVVLAAYLSDALRYSLTDRLDRLGIPSRSHRPSRSLREEPATRCLLTLAKLVHPEWGLTPPPSDVAYALMQAIADLDLVRAQLLTQIVYRRGMLAPFEGIKPDAQERITYVLGGRYDHLREWIDDSSHRTREELDHFLSRLFGEVLSQPGYGFHADYNAGAVAANLVESVQKFRWVASGPLAAEGVPLGKEYLQMVEDGVIAAQYLFPWQIETQEAVFLAPAYTFLMSNRPVEYQFWLDVGGRGWHERLYQPLTHPYVLNRHWPPGRPWTDADENEAAHQALYRLVTGLLRRCRRGVYLGLSMLGEQGYEQTGELLRAIDRALRDQ